MITWNVLSEQEARDNSHLLQEQYRQVGVGVHPITARPYSIMQHREERGQVYWVPLERPVPMELTDVTEVTDE